VSGVPQIKHHQSSIINHQSSIINRQFPLLPISAFSLAFAPFAAVPCLSFNFHLEISESIP
jgi:hypothetical protein